MGRKRYNNPAGLSEVGEYRDALPTASVGKMRGRGAGLNPGNRFETRRLYVLGEHLYSIGTVSSVETQCAGHVPTEVFPDRMRSVITRVSAPDVGFTWSFNPYRGCEHGCTYCYARIFHEMLGYSCGLDFETKIIAKFDAVKYLVKELANPTWHGEPIGMGSATDCYQPIERKLKITRACLELMAQCRQPVHITTKNRLIERDLDLLVELAQHRAAQVAISLTTLDASLAAKLEPRASSPADRLKAIATLSRAGVPVCVLTAPVIPGLTDRELPQVLQAAAQAGAWNAGFELLRLPGQVKALFLEWLARHFPNRAMHVENLIRQTRGGELDNPSFFVRFRGQGPMARQIQDVFKLYRRRYGLNRKMPPLSGAAFHHPPFHGQMPLFEMNEANEHGPITDKRVSFQAGACRNGTGAGVAG